MKLLYAATNIYHHMIPLVRAMIKITGEANFRYAVLQPIENFRIKMGFDPNNEDQIWTIRAYKNNDLYLEFVKWFKESDIVLFSDRSLFYLAKERTDNNKLTFYFSERWWKPPLGRFRLLHPKVLMLAIKLRKLSKNPNFHYLAQGGFATGDIRFFTFFKNRIWNWGYFPDVTENSVLRKTNSKIIILWCGRMLKWKRVDTLIKAFSLIIINEPDCILTIIGDGNEKENLQLIAKRNLPEYSYKFIPSLPANAIRETMNASDIYVLPSSGYEGWGAVINEAMAEGCAVIASKESGGGKAIIYDMKNGVLFKSKDYLELSNKLLLLLQNRSLLLKVKEEGKRTINELWSPEVAAERFLYVCSALLSNSNFPEYFSGPMQRL